MRTSLDLPDELIRSIKLRAVREDRTLEDLVADLLRRGLDDNRSGPPAAGRRVELPLIHGAHRAAPEDEMTPERVADVLVEEEEARGAGVR